MKRHANRKCLEYMNICRVKWNGSHRETEDESKFLFSDFKSSLTSRIHVSIKHLKNQLLDILKSEIYILHEFDERQIFHPKSQAVIIFEF